MGGSVAEVLTGIPMPVVLIGADERVAEVNPAAQALFGTGLVGRHHGLGFRQPDLLAAIVQARHCLTLDFGSALRLCELHNPLPSGTHFSFAIWRFKEHVEEALADNELAIFGSAH